MATPRKKPEDLLRRGRKTIYAGDETVQQVYTYLQEREDEYETYLEMVEKEGEDPETVEVNTGKIKQVKIPSVAGLASHLGVVKDTIYQWAHQYPEFSDALQEVSNRQEIRLLDNGLGGKYNSTITKLMLHNHGYADRSDQNVVTEDVSTDKIDPKQLAREILGLVNDVTYKVPEGRALEHDA
jgi:hypothetical protein